MNRNADIVNELKELNSPLADMPWQMPYMVPDGYFAQLAEHLAEGVRYADADDPSVTLPKALPFAVPDGYFDELAQGLRATVGESDLESGIESPYHTPAGYLENLPEALTLVAKNTEAASVPKGKAISFYPQWRRISRIAAAAVLVFGIGFGTYSYFHAKAPEVIAKKQLSKLDPMIIDTYVSQHVDEFDAEALEATVASSQTDAHAAISTLDESEIQEYLQETGEINNTAAGREIL